MAGQKVEAIVERVVDGDTLRLSFGGKSVSTRMQCLDTEESQAGGDKPVTPWGVKTSEYVKTLIPAGSRLSLLLQSEAPLFDLDGTVAVDHLDNFKRLLGFLFLPAPVGEGGPPTDDFQELMIRQGYSPYFVKYGRVAFPQLDQRYSAAERTAQAAGRGLWDQLAVNGAVARDYPLLSIWWELRAQLIDAFRRARATDVTGRLLNSRLDYSRLVELAAVKETVTFFLELREMTASGRHAFIDTGSHAQPFKVFIENADSPDVDPLRRLLANRYLSTDETRPKRNYAYVTGQLQLWRDKPEILVRDVEQISDSPPLQ